MHVGEDGGYGDPRWAHGTNAHYEYINQQNAAAADTQAPGSQAQPQSSPYSLDNAGSGQRRPGRPPRQRKLTSKALFFTVPLGVIALAVSGKSDGTTWPFLWERVIFCVLIIALGSPKLRRGAIPLLVLALIITWMLGP